MATLLRYLWRGAVVIFVLVALVLAVGYGVLRASLPVLDGRVALKGLSAPVQVERDAGGVPTITGATQADVARALGFLHAQDRFFEMDLLRRVSAGELAELVGPAALDTDRKHRVHQLRALAKDVATKVPADLRAVAEAYTDGVNAGLAALGSRPFEYWMLNTSPAPWRVEDSLLVAYTMYLDLQDTDGHIQLQHDLLKASLPPAAYDFVYGAVPEWESTLDGSRSTVATIPSAAEFNLRAAASLDTAVPASVLRQLSAIGSNNWAVAGSRTTTGAALVANDMHLGFRVPTIWYRARLIVGATQPGAQPSPPSVNQGSDATGVSLPGTPALIAGSNGHIAWGFTNSYGEYQVLVRLVPVADRPGFYAMATGAEALKEVHDRILVKGGNPVDIVIQQSRFGPVIGHDHQGVPVALSWAAHQAEATNMAIARLSTAQSVTEALDLAPSLGMPHQNLMVGDAQGHIGWTIAGRIPRHGPVHNLPQQSTDPLAGLQGWVSAADYPRRQDPSDGVLWTANTHVLGGAEGLLLGDLGSDRGARAGQIHDDLLARPVLTPKDSLAIQLDDRALFLARWKDLLATTLAGEPGKGFAARAAFEEVLGRWSGHAAVDDPAYRLVRRFREEVEARAYYALIAPARAKAPDFQFKIPDTFEGPLWTLLQARPEHLLPARYGTWDDLLLEAATAASAVPKGCDSLPSCTWGRVHVTRVAHPLAKAVPSLAGALNMPDVTIPGDENMPRVIADGYGASERFSVSPGHEADAYFHMPGGQSGHPLSAYYRAGFAAWASGEPTPFLPGAKQHALTFAP